MSKAKGERGERTSSPAEINENRTTEYAGILFWGSNEFFYRKASTFNDGIEGSRFNSFRAMHGNDTASRKVGFMPHNYVGTTLAFNNKSVPLESTDNFFTRNTRQLGHTETSTSLNSTSTSDPGIGNLSSLSDQINNSRASLILDKASSILSPWEAHPGRAGTWTEYPPSASGSTITLNRLNILFIPPNTKYTTFSMRSQGVNPLESAEERFRSLLSDNSWGRVSKGAEEIFKRLSGISAKDIASSSPIDGKTTFSQFGSLVNSQMQVSSPVKIEFDDIAKMDYLVLESGVRQLLSPALEEIHKIHLG